jgi:hypothetical protein
MVWILGNSHERVAIKDLNDVIYYRQKKQYTDQEFEGSRDLQREIQKGRIIKLEHVPEIKGSLPDNLSERANQSVLSSSLELSEIKRVITEVVSEQQSGVDIKELVTNLVPMIAEAVRQEVSKIQVNVGSVEQVVQKVSQTTFRDPGYIPDINTEGLKSNINIESQSISGQGMANSLELLKKLRQ